MDNAEIVNKDPLVITVNMVDTLPQTAANYGVFFTAHRPYQVVAVSSVFGTASTSGTVNVEKLTGTTAKGGGTTLLVSAFSTAGTVNTVSTKKSASFTAPTNGLYPVNLAVGDRLALVSSGTLTNLKDLQITVSLNPQGKGHYAI